MRGLAVLASATILLVSALSCCDGAWRLLGCVICLRTAVPATPTDALPMRMPQRAVRWVTNTKYRLLALL